MIIDCDGCVMKDVACADCVVSFLTDPRDLSDAESRAVAVLAGSGLVPPLRMAPVRAHERHSAAGGHCA